MDNIHTSKEKEGVFLDRSEVGGDFGKGPALISCPSWRLIVRKLQKPKVFHEGRSVT